MGVQAFGRAAFAALLAATLAQPLSAQEEAEDPNADIKERTTRAEEQAKRYEAEKKEYEAKANRDKARIEALGLPSFDGKATLKDGAGALEATMLSASALDEAAAKIADGLTGEYLVLAGQEDIGFAQAAALKVETEALQVELRRAIALADAAAATPAHRDADETNDGAISVISAISAAAGLLRSDVEISAVETPAITDRLFATAVAAKLEGRAFLPAAAVSIEAKAETSPLISSFQALASAHIAAEAHLARLDEKKDGHKRAISTLEAVIKRSADFYTRVTSSDDKGKIPLSEAVRIEQLLPSDRKVLRVFVDGSGGSVLNIKNIATTFGADPLRVSGGLLTHFEVTNPKSGQLEKGGALICRSALATLRQVQNGTWNDEGASNGYCTRAGSGGRGAAQ